jgi:hypothetical protein
VKYLDSLPSGEYSFYYLPQTKLICKPWNPEVPLMSMFREYPASGRLSDEKNIICPRLKSEI